MTEKSAEEPYVCGVCKRPLAGNQFCIRTDCLQLRQALALERIADALVDISGNLDRLGDLTQYGSPP